MQQFIGHYCFWHSLMQIVRSSRPLRQSRRLHTKFENVIHISVHVIHLQKAADRPSQGENVTENVCSRKT